MSKIELIHGDCLIEMKKIPDKSIDLVLTDPPYGISLDLSWQDKLHGNKNKSSERIIGDDKPFDNSTLTRFPKRIVFGFPMIYDPTATGWFIWHKEPGFKGRSFINPVEMAYSTTWKGFRIKELLWSGYLKKSDDNRYKHPTQKPSEIIRYLIRENSKEGDTILDPFMGSGTTGVACKELGRNFIGIEIDKNYFEIAQKRIANTQEMML